MNGTYCNLLPSIMIHEWHVHETRYNTLTIISIWNKTTIKKKKKTNPSQNILQFQTVIMFYTLLSYHLQNPTTMLKNYWHENQLIESCEYKEQSSS